jgi:cystathionine gamma-lyase
MEHKVDTVVCGVGSSGTITGLTRYFKQVSPLTEFIPADPKGSILADYINQYHQNAVGAVVSPFDSYLTLRGIKTLALRMEQHQKNALYIAHYLEKHPKVSKVIYPGLRSHPQHELFSSQASGYGGVLSFEIKGSITDTERFPEALTIFALAESLGGVKSLAELPSLMTHASVNK